MSSGLGEVKKHVGPRCLWPRMLGIFRQSESEEEQRSSPAALVN